MEWMPIESAPKTGEHVLLYGTQGETDMIGAVTGAMSGYWDSIDEAWCSPASTWAGPFINATHWQPLPEPPSA